MQTYFTHRFIFHKIPMVEFLMQMFLNSEDIRVHFNVLFSALW